MKVEKIRRRRKSNRKRQNNEIAICKQKMKLNENRFYLQIKFP